MTAENIKMLIEAFQALGGDAKEAFLVWVVCDKGVPLLGILVCAVALYLIVRTIARAVLASQDDTVALHEIGRKLGIEPSEYGWGIKCRNEVARRVEALAQSCSADTTVTSCSCADLEKSRRKRATGRKNGTAHA